MILLIQYSGFVLILHFPLISPEDGVEDETSFREKQENRFRKYQRVICDCALVIVLVF